MRLIYNIIFYIGLIIGGLNHSKQPARLSKQSYSYNNISIKLEQFVYRNAPVLFFTGIIIAMLLFVALAFVIVGASATDSGLTYNYLMNGGI